MPKDSSIKSVLIIGSGPIVIGQACEFDYSGSQAARSLREEGIEVTLINSNPATIMTDPVMADNIYLKPLEPESIVEILKIHDIDAVLPTMGGQTALNLAIQCDELGIWEEYGVRIIGVDISAIEITEDREQFRLLMERIGIPMAPQSTAKSFLEGKEVAQKFGYPLCIRASFTLGGAGAAVVHTKEDFEDKLTSGLHISPIHEVMIDKALLGWKEFELELLRDSNNNVTIVCSIENMDPMGIHTGDSITVAPALTLSDTTYQRMRDMAIKMMRSIGEFAGGCNVQFAVSPDENEDIIAIEINPRVSRSSALASKATGFPIAKVAALLSVGFTLDELQNDITGGLTPASFEPSIDYIVTKMPKFAFEKFTQANDRLTTQMKSVGEVMAIGTNFQESLQKAICSMEEGLDGLNSVISADDNLEEKLQYELSFPGPQRIFYVADAMRSGWSNEKINSLSGIDFWFLNEIRNIINQEQKISSTALEDLEKIDLYNLKKIGFSDSRLAFIMNTSEISVRSSRLQKSIKPVFKRVDTCAAEFLTTTCYMYSTYGGECESNVTTNKKVMVLGSGPNRIGQGIEFDYCCVHASLAMQEEGYESIMVNCNPETVSTDYDVSNRLYFEPITSEKIMDIIEIENPDGVIIQFGGQTPLKLASTLQESGVNILGTDVDAIDRSEDRERFQELVEKLDLKQPMNTTVRNLEEALASAVKIGYPIVVRPSYVLGGRAMQLVHNDHELEIYFKEAVDVSNKKPILLDSYLTDAIEIDVDIISDGTNIMIGGILQHIEQAGIHSGDSACSLPPYSLSESIIKRLEAEAVSISKELNIIGLMNIQFAVKEDDIYIIEVNPRASRTVPFISKAIGSSLVKAASKSMVNKSLLDQNFSNKLPDNLYFVKEAVLPFDKLLPSLIILL